MFFVLDGMPLELPHADLAILARGEGWLNNGIEAAWCFLGADGCHDLMPRPPCAEEVREGGGGFWGEQSALCLANQAWPVASQAIKL